MAARLVIAAAFVAAALAPAAAQQYQRLHVRRFTVSSDTPQPRVEVPFSVTLTIVVPERVSSLENVYLPGFTGAEELGDVRSISTNLSGSTYRETLQLVAHASGPLAITPAYLDAIDARDGKPKRFISNALRLEVEGPASGAGTLAGKTVKVVALAVAVVLAIAILVTRRRRPVHPLAVQAPLEPQRAREDPVAAALAQLRARRDRSSVLALRRVLWEEVGANEGQTLAQVLALPFARDPRIRRMLAALEKAAFVDDADLERAIEDVLA